MATGDARQNDLLRLLVSSVPMLSAQGPLMATIGALRRIDPVEP